VIFRYSCRAVVIAAACIASAAKLHSRETVGPFVATQELNRCLSVVRAAARRTRGRAVNSPDAPSRYGRLLSLHLSARAIAASARGPMTA
jgi:hypothetical protein